MTNEAIPISPATQSTLRTLAARIGRPAADVLAEAVEEFRQRHSEPAPVESIPGVNPADVWEAAAEADAGLLTSHAETFARLRNRT